MALLKQWTLALLQGLLGFETYLQLFARFKIRTLHADPRERDFLAFLRSIPEDAFVLDVGANLGVMTAHLSRRLRRGAVVAFEPVPENLAVLRRVIAERRLDNVRVEACALGDRDGTAEMVMPVERGARRHGLSHVVHPTIAERNEGRRLTVAMRRLDGFTFSSRVAAIKLDVENFERFVLEGALATLRRDRPALYVELWPNENRKRCLEILAGLGYRAFVCESGRETPYDPERHARQNFIFRSAGS